MKSKAFVAGLLSACAITVVSARDIDSLKVIQLKTVEVTSTRASDKTPVAFSVVGQQTIRKENFGVDLPFLLLSTPSVVATSDAGTGIGYTGLRIRGTDPSRINVTANGIPVNDAESSTVFWVNMPDFASSINDIQIQRGVGTSTNGAGAFGGSINITTDELRTEPYAEVAVSYGSFNTRKHTVKLGTGLMHDRFTMDARLSNITSDGYVRRASVDLNSYFVQAGYAGKTTALRLVHFTGKEVTYHAWDGITREQMEQDRRYNSSGQMLDTAGNLIGYYDNQTDNYLQKNFQVLLSQQLSEKMTLNLSLHYTDGYGYYEEYKNAQNLRKYGLDYFQIDSQKVTKSNLVRRKIMENDFGGAVFSLDYEAKKLKFSLGGAANRYSGDHFGNVIWVKNFIGDIQPDHEYYRNHSVKDDANIYTKAEWEISSKVNVYADMQYRHVRHSIQGLNDEWDSNAGTMQILNVNESFNFFNPKAGLFYSPNEHNNLYASVAIAHKEPRRDDFKDMRPGMQPKAEQLYDYELGWRYFSPALSFGVNLYYMDYTNQLVQTGERNDIGEPLSKNMPESYRAGVELTFALRFTEWLRWRGNATFSRNIIRNYTDYIYDESGEVVYKDFIGNATIAYSPSIIAGSILSVDHRGWNWALQSNFVGRQFMNNAMSPSAELREYFVNNLRMAYTFKPGFMESITLGVAVNNLFNAKYANNGFAGRYIDDDGEIGSWAVFFPQATMNILLNLSLEF